MIIHSFTRFVICNDDKDVFYTGNGTSLRIEDAKLFPSLKEIGLYFNDFTDKCNLKTVIKVIIQYEY